MSKQRYSEAFLNSNFLDVEKVKVILYNGINVDICNAVNNRVKSLYLDSNFVDEKDGLFSIIMDHYVYKRIIEGKNDLVIIIYLKIAIDLAYNNKRVYILNLFLPFNLERNIIKKYLTSDYRAKLDEIDYRRNDIEKDISNITKIENNKVYFDNGKSLSERLFLEFLIVNIPTDDKKIEKLQQTFFVMKMKEVLAKIKVVNDKLLLIDGREAYLRNLNLDNLFLHFITKYYFYDEIGDTRYNEFSKDKSLIRDDIVFNYCSSFSKKSGFYASYNRSSLSANFSLSEMQNSNIDIIFHLLASRHEARHAIQFNCKNASIPSVKDAHFASILFRLDQNDYSTNYYSQTIEHDANRKPLFIIAKLFDDIGRSDIAQLARKTYNKKIRDILFEVRTSQTGDTQVIWEADGMIIDRITIDDLKKYPELEFLFDINGQTLKHKRLIDLFKIDLDIKGRRIFESSFMNNYIRYRSLHTDELDEIITYMLNNNIDTKSPLFLNINGMMFNFLEEMIELTNNVDYVIDAWKINTSSNDQHNNIKLIHPFFLRLETQLYLISKLSVLSSKYNLVERRIIDIKINILRMVEYIINHYREMKESFVIKTKNYHNYLSFINSQYHYLLFVNKIEDIAKRYLDININKKISSFKKLIINDFGITEYRIKTDKTLSIVEKEDLLKKSALNTSVHNVTSIEQFGDALGWEKTGKKAR